MTSKLLPGSFGRRGASHANLRVTGPYQNYGNYKRSAVAGWVFSAFLGRAVGHPGNISEALPRDHFAGTLEVFRG